MFRKSDRAQCLEKNFHCSKMVFNPIWTRSLKALISKSPARSFLKFSILLAHVWKKTLHNPVLGKKTSLSWNEAITPIWTQKLVYFMLKVYSKDFPNILITVWSCSGKINCPIFGKTLFRKWVISTQIWVRRLVCFVC